MSIFKCIFICILAILFFLNEVSAEQKPIVVVIGFTSDSILAPKAEQIALSYLVAVGESNFFSLSDTIVADSIVDSVENKKTCRSLECLAVIAASLEVDYILYGSFAMLSDIYVVNVKLFGSSEGKIVSRDYYAYNGEFNNMLNEKIKPSFVRLSSFMNDSIELEYDKDTIPAPLVYETDSAEYKPKVVEPDFYDFLSDSVVCAKEHSRGKEDASKEHGSFGWLAGGFMAGAFGNILGAVAVAAVATHISVEPPPESKEINFCYSAGYNEYAKRKNLNFALYGASAGIAMFFVFAYLNGRE